MIENVNFSQKPEKTVKLDLKDRKIIQELERNSRQSNSSIAQKLKISKQAVAYRINRMLRQGVIKNFLTCVNTQKLGYSCYNLYVQLGWISQEQEKQLEAFFEKEPNITWAATGVGSWNLVTTVMAKTAEEFHQTSIRIFQQCENISSHANFIATEAYTLPNQYLYHDIPQKLEKTTIISQKDQPAILDKHDLRILQELSENARITNTELSQKLKLKTGKTSYKIRKMEEQGVIQAYKPMLNVQNIGRNTHIIMLKLNYKTQEQEKQLLNHIRSMPCTKYVEKGIGRWDLAVAIQQKDMEHFNQIINELREKFKTTINTFETMLILKEYKCHFIPKNITTV